MGIFTNCLKQNYVVSSISGKLINQIFIINNKGIGFFYKIPFQKNKFMILPINY